MKKPVKTTDADCWHGLDGLGDIPDFEAQNNGTILDISFEEHINAVKEECANAHDAGQ